MTPEENGKNTFLFLAFFCAPVYLYAKHYHTELHFGKDPLK